MSVGNHFKTAALLLFFFLMTGTEALAQKKMTIKQFLKMSDKDTTVVELRGVVTRVRNFTNGNLYIKDNTGTVLIWGIRDGSSQGRKYPDLDVRIGDTLTLVGTRYLYNKSVIEMINPKLIAKGNGPDHDKMGSGGERKVVNATFKGKDKGAFALWVSHHLTIPRDANGNPIEGTVTVRFVVGRDGNVQEVQLEKGVHPLLNEEALRVVKSSPKWKPRTVNGNPTRETIIMPISFNQPK